MDHETRVGFYLVTFIVVCGVLAALAFGAELPWRDDEPMSCTLEARICPDGSAVGRVPPSCEFAACPTPSVKAGTLVGIITLSPTCPVETVPADPACAPRPYHTGIEVWRGSRLIISKASSERGEFSFLLEPGSYRVVGIGGAVFPQCEPKDIEVFNNATTTVDLSCDTGIR